MLLLVALMLLLEGAYIPAKAQVAQWLLQRAWQVSSTEQKPVRPWPWADTWPVARLLVPAKAVDLIVLEGDHGGSLAFAPGMRIAKPDDNKVTLISAHRDTHFKFVQTLDSNDRIELIDPGREKSIYRVAARQIVDSRQSWRLPRHEGRLLILMTCYPFNAIHRGGPLRYVVIADEQFAKASDKQQKKYIKGEEDV